MDRRELYEAVNAEMNMSTNKIVALLAQQKEIEQQIEYWKRQEDAARTVSIRLDCETRPLPEIT